MNLQMRKYEMNLMDAVNSGKRFRRKYGKPSWDCYIGWYEINSSNHVITRAYDEEDGADNLHAVFSLSDFHDEDDWEVEERRSVSWEEVENTILHNSAPSSYINISNIKKNLGFQDE